MAGATITDPDITDSQGSMTVTLQELTFPKYGTVQHPALTLKSVTYCIQVELALEQSIHMFMSLCDQLGVNFGIKLKHPWYKD